MLKPASCQQANSYLILWQGRNPEIGPWISRTSDEVLK